MKKKTTMFTRSISKMRLRMIKDALSDAPKTPKQLGDEVFITATHARAYVKFLHEKGRIHIATYRRNVTDYYKRYQPLYVWGKGVDAVKPKPLSDAERSRLRRMNPTYLAKEHAAQKRLREQRKQKQAAWPLLKEAA